MCVCGYMCVTCSSHRCPQMGCGQGTILEQWKTPVFSRFPQVSGTWKGGEEWREESGHLQDRERPGVQGKSVLCSKAPTWPVALGEGTDTEAEGLPLSSPSPSQALEIVPAPRTLLPLPEKEAGEPPPGTSIHHTQDSEQFPPPQAPDQSGGPRQVGEGAEPGNQLWCLGPPGKIQQPPRRKKAKPWGNTCCRSSKEPRQRRRDQRTAEVGTGWAERKEVGTEWAERKRGARTRKGSASPGEESRVHSRCCPSPMRLASSLARAGRTENLSGPGGEAGPLMDR